MDTKKHNGKTKTPQGDVEIIPAEKPSKAIEFKQTNIIGQVGKYFSIAFLLFSMTLLVLGTASIAADPQENYDKLAEKKAQAEYELAVHKLNQLGKKDLSDATDEDWSELKRLRDKVTNFSKGK